MKCWLLLLLFFITNTIIINPSGIIVLSDRKTATQYMAKDDEDEELYSGVLIQSPFGLAKLRFFCVLDMFKAL